MKLSLILIFVLVNFSKAKAFQAVPQMLGSYSVMSDSSTATGRTTRRLIEMRVTAETKNSTSIDYTISVTEMDPSGEVVHSFDYHDSNRPVIDDIKSYCRANAGQVEDLVLSSGTFETCKIQVRDRLNDTVSWMAAGVPFRIVKIQNKRLDTDAAFTRELLKFNMAH